VNVAFTNAGGGTITIDPNMSPLSTTVNSSGHHQFIGGPIDSGALVKSGTGTLRLSNANTYPGGSWIKGGTLLLHHAAAAGSGAITLGDSAGTDAATLHVAANITNAIVVQGGATSPGTLRSSSADGRRISGSISLADDLVVWHTGDRDTCLSGDILFGGIGDILVSAAIGGKPENLTKLGNSNLILAGPNTYAGVATLQRGCFGPGTLVAGVEENPGVSGPFGVPATPAGSIVFDGGGLGWSAANTYDYSPRFAINNGKEHVFAPRGQTVLYCGPVSFVRDAEACFADAGTMVALLGDMCASSGVLPFGTEDDDIARARVAGRSLVLREGRISVVASR
jgi:autotransporter-associated beta strand protein